MGDPAAGLLVGIPGRADGHPPVVPSGRQQRAPSGDGPGRAPSTALWSACGKVRRPTRRDTDASGQDRPAHLRRDRGDDDAHGHQARSPHPYQATIPVVATTTYVGYQPPPWTMTSGTSPGNGDGVVNPGETIELARPAEQLRHPDGQRRRGDADQRDPYVTIGDADETFGNIAGGRVRLESTDDFDVTIATACPHGRTLRFGLAIRSGVNTWHSLVTLPVVSADLVAEGSTLYNVGGNGILDPGESGQISIGLRNNGGAAGNGNDGHARLDEPLRDRHRRERISTASIAGGSPVENTQRPLRSRRGGGRLRRARRHAVARHAVLGRGRGHRLLQRSPIGARAAGDPVGPDRHGYLAYRRHGYGVSGRAELPVGGARSDLRRQRDRDPSDRHRHLPGRLRGRRPPFPFVYYGASYTKATVCSNGWIAMGSQWNDRSTATGRSPAPAVRRP